MTPRLCWGLWFPTREPLLIKQQERNHCRFFLAMVPPDTEMTKPPAIYFIHGKNPAPDFTDTTDYHETLRINFPDHPFQPGQLPLGNNVTYQFGFLSEITALRIQNSDAFFQNTLFSRPISPQKSALQIYILQRALFQQSTGTPNGCIIHRECSGRYNSVNRKMSRSGSYRAPGVSGTPWESGYGCRRCICRVHPEAEKYRRP